MTSTTAAASRFATFTSRVAAVLAVVEACVVFVAALTLYIVTIFAPLWAPVLEVFGKRLQYPTFLWIVAGFSVAWILVVLARVMWSATYLDGSSRWARNFRSLLIALIMAAHVIACVYWAIVGALLLCVLAAILPVTLGLGITAAARAGRAS
jgi:hypothetical protein